MCEMCHSIPCHPRCPNAPEPVPVLKCRRCKEGIFEGDRYYTTKTAYIYEECLGEMTATELLEYEEEILETAEKEER